MNKSRMLVRRAVYIWRVDGPISLVKRAFTFLVGCFYLRETYYLYEHDLSYRNEGVSIPNIPGIKYEVIFDNGQADKLAARGLEFRSVDGVDRQRLDKGAIAVCIFIGDKIAYRTWIATNEDAQQAITDLPYRLDYSRNEAFCGGTFVSHEFRRKGLMTYGYFKKLELLRERGASAAKGVVAAGNIASHKALTKHSPKVYGVAEYIKVLWWKSWKERPLMNGESPLRTRGDYNLHPQVGD